MEEILAKLLISNSKAIQEGTKELKEAFKKPTAILELCDVVVTSQNVQIRQSAAVLLRRKLGRRRHWNKLNVDIRNRIKQGMLQALVNEQEKLVKNSIAQFIGIIGKHEFPDNSWPEVLQFIHNLCSHENLLDRELGMYTLSIMTEISESSYITYADSCAVLFTNMLNSAECNSNLAYYTVQTMKNLVAVVSGHQQMVNVYCLMMPKILEVIRAFCQIDEKKACDLFEILEELIESAISVIVPHIRAVVQLCLETGSNTAMETTVQIKAISVVGWLVKSKGKIVLKHKLVEPIIDVLIQLMAQQPEDDGNEKYFLGDPEQFTSITVATQTLDVIAMNIPADKVVPYLLTKVEPAIHGGDIYAQKAAYLSLAVLSEGCAERIRLKYLEPFLKCVCTAIHNPDAVVRNAALFALGQFAEHLQPEISQYAAELLPVLFECLRQVLAQMEVDKTNPQSLDRLFYALETFCENLEEGLMPYLPIFMELLFASLDPNGWSFKLKRVALSALGAAASAVKDGLLPYFPKTIEVLNVYINSDPNAEIHQLQCYAIETLAVVAQFIGVEHFKPLAGESLKLGMQILNDTNDPDVRKAIYALFAALAIVMKEEISPVLPKIVEEMIQSIQSSEGIVTQYEEDEKDDLDVYDESSDEEDDDEEDIEGASSCSDDSGQCRYTVENSYNEEKEQACLTLREICINTGASFLPYIEKSFEEIFKLINYPQDDIRKASVEALLQFCIALYKIQTNETKQALYKALQMFVPKCAELIRMDEERGVVMVCLDAYAALLEECKGEVLVGEGHREAIMNCVIDVLNMKTMCQDNDLGAASAESNEDDDEAEQDELLLESASDVIPKFASAITPEDFYLYFPNVLQLLTNRTKKQNSPSQRSVAFGTLSELMSNLGTHVEKFVPILLHLWLSGAKDKEGEVRNNAIYGLGEMILHGREKVFPHYQEVLQALSTAITKETHSGSLDNICGALAKIIIVYPGGNHLEQIFPALLQRLPLRDDFAENKAVVNCFSVLYQQGNSLLKQHLQDVIKVLVHVYHNEQTPDEETKAILEEFLKTINRDFHEEFATAVTNLAPEATGSLQRLLGA